MSERVDSFCPRFVHKTGNMNFGPNNFFFFTSLFQHCFALWARNMNFSWNKFFFTVRQPDVLAFLLHLFDVAGGSLHSVRWSLLFQMALLMTDDEKYSFCMGLLITFGAYTNVTVGILVQLSLTGFVFSFEIMSGTDPGQGTRLSIPFGEKMSQEFHPSCLCKGNSNSCTLASYNVIATDKVTKSNCNSQFLICL